MRLQKCSATLLKRLSLFIAASSGRGRGGKRGSNFCQILWAKANGVGESPEVLKVLLDQITSEVLVNDMQVYCFQQLKNFF